MYDVPQVPALERSVVRQKTLWYDMECVLRSAEPDMDKL